MEIPRQRKPSVRMDMTPLIDCVFQLLIFFMLSSTFLAPHLRLELPRAAAQPISSRSDAVTISIGADGEVFLNNDRLDWDQLAPRLRVLVERAERKVVTVRCDETAEHRHFVRALDAARSSGAEHLNVAYQQTKAASP